MAATGDGCSTVGSQGAPLAVLRDCGAPGWCHGRVCVTVGGGAATQPGAGAAASAEGSTARPVRAAPMAATVTSAIPNA
jgi:hypothetical protein